MSSKSSSVNVRGPTDGERLAMPYCGVILAFWVAAPARDRGIRISGDLAGADGPAVRGDFPAKGDEA
jgi:hypothetical protein